MLGAENPQALKTEKSNSAYFIMTIMKVII